MTAEPAPAGEPAPVAEPPAATDSPPPAGRHAVFHPLRVAAVDRLTDDAVAVTFAVPPELAAAYRFRAGQHLTLRATAAGDDQRRSYSICSPEGGPLTVAVKRLPGGVFSAFAHTRLAPGDLVEVMTPAGRFTLPPAGSGPRHYAAFAAGSGITPVLSLVTTALEREPASRVTLAYGNRTTATIMFLDELADLKDRFTDRLQVIHVLSAEPQPVQLCSGRLDPPRVAALLDSLLPVASVDEWLVCGPATMIDGILAVLAERGVDPTRVHRELFHVGPAPARPARPPRGAAGGATVTVRLDGRSSTLTMDPDGESVLEAALRVRPDAPYSCRNGMCGTCRARLVEGQVEMDHNYALERDELADGFVLACQSRPLTDRLLLDFDA